MSLRSMSETAYGASSLIKSLWGLIKILFVIFIAYNVIKALSRFKDSVPSTTSGSEDKSKSGRKWFSEVSYDSDWPLFSWTRWPANAQSHVPVYADLNAQYLKYKALDRVPSKEELIKEFMK